MPHYDAIVIGAGSMGSSAACHLARRGAQVLALEKFEIPHVQGSYAGVNRIIRLTYWEHPSYVPLLRRAYELWREIERISGERLLWITGNIDAGPENGRLIAGALKSCKEHHLSYAQFDAASLHKRFPGYCLPQDMAAIYQEDGGFILSERAVAAYAEAARSFGAHIHCGEAVESWEATGKTASVRTNCGQYSANHLIFTAGPWTTKLLPILSRVLAPERQVLIWAEPLRPEYFRLGAFPVFYMESDDGRFYGFPVHGAPGFKLGKYHHRGERADPDQFDRNIHPEDEEILRRAIRRFFPDADGPTAAMRTCMFTNTPDEHFIIDRHPAFPQVLVAAGFSGHGFKFSSVVGEIMADLALEGGARHDLSLFRLERFNS